MRKNNIFVEYCLAVILSLFPFSGNALADDTEIFFNIEQDVSAPNILFILDNSGSMRETVEVKALDYDPAKTYHDGSYTKNDVYYKQGSRYYRIRQSALECSDIESKLNALGKTAPYRMALWKEATQSRLCQIFPWFCDQSNQDGDWVSLNRDNVTAGPVICEADNQKDRDITWEGITPHVFYSGNYLNWLENYREVTWMKRMEIVKQVAKNLADGLENVNIGLMAFDKNAWDKGEGGVILDPVSPLSGSGREDFKEAVDELGHDTNTPLAETLFGAMRYFGGQKPFLSDSEDQVTSAMDGTRYKSPIELQCQANHIVLLSDGVPTKDDNHNAEIKSEIGETNCPYIIDDNNRNVQNCLAEIADYMFNNDIYEKNVEAAKGSQHVTTHTVGFTLGQELLAETARRGGGSYYLADNADELELAFNAIFREVLATNTTFSSPGVSVNNFNQLNHLDTLYFSVFEPVVNPLWPGNLKRYRLKSDGTIVDQNGNSAVDSATGFFKEGAQSYWSSSADGSNVRLGGVAGELDDNNGLRNVYTYYPGSTSKSLKASVNNVSVSNSSNLKKEFFGNADMSNAQHEALIRWTRGQDVADDDKDGRRSESRQFMADPLHSRPYLQVYGGSEENPDTTVFYGDNQGFLHAVDGEIGKLHFSFIPAELLKNQSVLMSNQVGEHGRPYGMDGSVVPWFKDSNGNRIVDAGDSVYIYAGMRRGGRNYYGLDVTKRDSPSMLWTIRGGMGNFKELGQSWSDPVKHKVRIGSQIRDVLFFSGGYDSQQDNASVLTEDGIGRAIYMVDAKTGERLWWAGHGDSDADLELNDMRYSIPATPAVIDVNGDGLADQLYVGDMGGQVWRVDFQHGLEAEGFATAGVIARFAGGSSETNRRFYHSPDISGTLKNGNRYLNLAIGSGYQAHPLDTTISDRFYKLTISTVSRPANGDGTVEYKTLTEADLFDATDNLIQEGDKAEKEGAETALAEANGWYIQLPRKGEKVLSSSTTLRGDLYFTTFEPSASLDACIPSAGQSRLYHVKLRDGRAVVNYDGTGTDDELTASDRYVTLKTLGLPPSPIPVTIDGKEVIVAGTETLMPPEPEALVRKIYWYEE